MSSKKARSCYVCKSCGHVAMQWMGQCPQCQSFNTLEEEQRSSSSKAGAHYAGSSAATEVVRYDAIEAQDVLRFSSGNPEFDRVLGGGFVPGSVCILSGDPGVGKSTLMLQILASLSPDFQALYLSGEESLSQIRLRGERLGMGEAKFHLATATHLETIESLLKKHQPKFLVIDSIQTLESDHLDAIAGSVSQIRYCAQVITRYAKQNHATVLMIGHVNKDGAIAGPKVFEHLVDTVLYLESDDQGRYRLLRTLKNRFGAINELGILCMTQEGLKAVKHPSALFTSHQAQAVSGTAVTALWEGSRVLLVEIQSLVVDSPQYQAKRLVVGFDAARLNLLLAILSRLNDWPGSRFDVFLNVVGGLKIAETAADAAVLAAVFSSFKNKILPRQWVFFGEIGLGGEMRPVQYAVERVQEALKHGYTKVFLPQANQAGLKELQSKKMIHFFGHARELIAFIAEHHESG